MSYVWLSEGYCCFPLQIPVGSRVRLVNINLGFCTIVMAIAFFKQLAVSRDRRILLS